MADFARRVARKPGWWLKQIKRKLNGAPPAQESAPYQHPLIAEDGAFWCPVCKTGLKEFAEFKPSPMRPGRKAACPVCWSLERTRAIRIFLEQQQALLSGKMLHFAPEQGLEKWLRSIDGLTLITTDLMDPKVDIQADICDLPFEDNEFRIIYCSNVLEHIPDDAKAMSELMRVLQPGGLAIIQVPVKGQTTYEDPSITEPEDRDKHFGQPDHVRYYGEDISERLEATGFNVEPVWMPGHLAVSADEIKRCGADKEELIHLCRR